MVDAVQDGLEERKNEKESQEQAQTVESAKTEKSETATEATASVQEEETPAVEQFKDEAPVLDADQEQVADEKDTDTGNKKNN